MPSGKTAPTEPSLVPRPERLTVHDGQFTVGPATRVHAPARVSALLRTLLVPATGLALADGGPGADTLSLTVTDAPQLGAEGYRLRVTPEGVHAVAGTEDGLCWAVQTLRQLLPPQAYGSAAAPGVPWRLPCVEIVDVPRYGWRGCLLDVARWCHPVPFLYRYVDLLAAHKLNTLHLHLTDDQGWRFEVHRWPRLTGVGGYRRESSAGHARERRLDGTPHGGWYRQAQLRELVGYAAYRGVRILPEIDLPGHSQAAIAAYPWLGNDPQRRLAVRTSWGISRHVLNVADQTVAFFRDVLDELADVFPYEYVHLGGDEVPLDEWAASPAAAARMASAGLAGLADLSGWWAGQLSDHLARLGRRPVVWDELLEHRPPPDATVQAWRGPDRVAAALRAGHDVIAAPKTHLYLDYAEADGPGEPLAIHAPLPLSTVYGYHPGPVLGLQGQLWSEYLPTPELVEWRAFPRLAAVAEVGWSGAAANREEDFRRRLTGHLRRLDALGVHYRPLG